MRDRTGSSLGISIDELDYSEKNRVAKADVEVSEKDGVYDGPNTKPEPDQSVEKGRRNFVKELPLEHIEEQLHDQGLSTKGAILEVRDEIRSLRAKMDGGSDRSGSKRRSTQEADRISKDSSMARSLESVFDEVEDSLDALESEPGELGKSTNTEIETEDVPEDDHRPNQGDPGIEPAREPDDLNDPDAPYPETVDELAAEEPQLAKTLGIELDEEWNIPEEHREEAIRLYDAAITVTKATDGVFS